MCLVARPFDFEYVPTGVVFGRGCVDSIAEKLVDRGVSRVLLVCGTNVGANRSVIEPVSAGIGDRLVDVFAETTPGKEIGTVLDGVDRMREMDVDCVVAVGGGSSMNVARAMCLVEALGRSRDDIVRESRETGAVPTPEESTPLTPNVLVPTTMAGADLTYDGGIRIPPEATPDRPNEEEWHSGSTSDPRLMPTMVFFDPALFATTPVDVLTSSAMNGFNKGIETVYSRSTNPLSEAHALRGLQYLHEGLPELRTASSEDDALDQAVIGTILVQYGRKTNFVHTFGNGLSSRYDVQQGTVHGIVAPHALRHIFENVDARRNLLARALDIDPSGRSDEQIASAIVDEVVALRDALGLPSWLRDVDGLERGHLPTVAETIVENRKHARNPPGLNPTTEDVLGVLRASW